MKRRNADCGKLRRPIKRNKITEGMYGSTTVLYMKFLVLWAIVITADFMFMFRFEFLWPFWLLLRSVHDSFKYKGLAFSVLFVCIAITSDLVCLFFIPVHWLLFAASTYVWVQYVWHTDKGICLPTIILWMLFVYLEAGIRWKDSRHMPHLDLCRPFAAHCIGYPVVTLGFGFKSYVGYRMRQRKQREVAKENEFYMQLLQQALPQEETLDEAQMAAAANGPITVAAATAQSAQNSSPTLTTLLTATATAAATSISSNNLLANSATLIASTSPSLSLSSTTTAATNSTTLSSSHNTMHTANGILGAGGGGGAGGSAQNHHNHHQQTNEHQIHHNNNNSCNNNNNNSNSVNFGNSSHISLSSTASTTTTAAATATTTTGAHSGSGSGNSAITNTDDKNYVQISGSGGGAISNGYIGGNSKNNRRSVEKEKHKGNANIGGDNETRHNKLNSHHSENNSNNNNNNNSSNKDKSDWDSSHNNYHQTQGGKDKHDAGYNSNSKKSHNTSGGGSALSNGNILQNDIDDVVTVEPVERTKGRRNRAKKDNASKDNHHNNNNNNNSNNSHANSNHLPNNHHHHHNHKDSSSNTHNNNNHHHNPNNNNNNNNNSDASSVSSSTSSSSTSSSSSVNNKAAASSNISNIAAKVVSKICETCHKFEADIKRYRSELSHMKQIENELRQKLESNLTTKSCLQAKQRECDDLEKRINELNNARHADMLQLQTAERRLTEERRQKQSLEAQLNNERKARKLAEEKAARPECSVQCKQRKQQMDEDIKQLRRELKLAEDSKVLIDQNSRKWEQELRKLEAEVRNRESTQQGTEMLMNALAAMQDKNCTLEKNLSAETRVKLDLFSALGDAKRQLEIAESRRRSKEDEVHDLKAKIAQLLAVMPTDSLCLPSCSSTGASSMLRMNDTPPLQTGPGPASPMLSNLGASQSNAPVGHQLNTRGVIPTSAADYVVQQSPSDYVGNQQQQCGVPVSMAAAVLASSAAVGGSNLDPNASIYTPKGGHGGPGGVVVVGGGTGNDA